ncbi:MAG: capsular polysaccharide biosynthesis protein, partial [Clostridia bacterium]|nr:capsular polysaccharide biosynthesis protein [Clostridia bacterium]
MNFDIHSHLIPNIDDGAQSIAESAKMLQILKDEGVDNILATPHFYPSRSSLDSFLAKRSASFDALAAEAEGKDLPAIH